VTCPLDIAVKIAVPFVSASITKGAPGSGLLTKLTNASNVVEENIFKNRFLTNPTILIAPVPAVMTFALAAIKPEVGHGDPSEANVQDAKLPLHTRHCAASTPPIRWEINSNSATQEP
jgi:hypothetical protein